MAGEAKVAEAGQSGMRALSRSLTRLLPGRTDRLASPVRTADPPGSDPLAGSGYRAIREIGRGGMAVVLEAEHVALGKRVVVKLLLTQLADPQQMGARLRREGRSLARLKSPFLVDVTDIGQTVDDSPFIVMELLRGHTLWQELKTRHVVPIADALRWTRQVLAGLSHAHRLGIVHRDVKLGNVFVCEPAAPGQPRDVKLLDFGIAKILHDPSGGMLSRHANVTVEGQLLGTPRCVAPEQALGRPVDARTDVYAVGAMLYALVAGRGPFEHIMDAIDLIGAHIKETPAAPSKYAAQPVPVELDRIVLRAMEKDPGARYPTADAFSEALAAVEALLTDTTQPLPPQALSAPPPAASPADDDDIARTRLLPGPAREEEDPPTVPVVPRRRPGVFLALTLASALVLTAIYVLWSAGGW
jgi:serine/threonine-protein kinase